MRVLYVGSTDRDSCDYDCTCCTTGNIKSGGTAVNYIGTRDLMVYSHGYKPVTPVVPVRRISWPPVLRIDMPKSAMQKKPIGYRKVLPCNRF